MKDLGVDTNIWRIKDKVWRKERREQWKYMKPKVVESLVPRSMIKHVQKYFLEGVIEKERPDYFLCFIECGCTLINQKRVFASYLTLLITAATMLSALSFLEV